MLYDNGQILEYLANLWSNGYQEPAIQRAIDKTVSWLKREMTAPEGYFYAAQDADSFIHSTAEEPEEGSFYVWDYAELKNLLTAEELAATASRFTVTPSGNFEGNNVLQRLHGGGIISNSSSNFGQTVYSRYGQTAKEIDTFPSAKNNQEAKTRNWSGRIPPLLILK